MPWRFYLLAALLAPLAACGPTYSPDTYAQNAAQQANKAEQGVIIGVRPVKISASGTVGTVTGAAAGGIAGSQAAAGPASALSALGGSLVGGLAGSAMEHATADTDAFEYIVRKTNKELVSVTQKDKTPLALGQKVLVIAGAQARVVPDYTVPPEALAPGAPGAKTPDAKSADTKPADEKSPDAKPADANPAETKPAEPAPGEPATAGPQPDDKPAAVPADLQI